jgi:hypothetical protein
MLFDLGYAARWGHANSDNGSEAGTPSPVAHLEGDREFADSPLEGDGFELLVPRHESSRFPTHSVRSLSP